MVGAGITDYPDMLEGTLIKKKLLKYHFNKRKIDVPLSFVD